MMKETTLQNRVLKAYNQLLRKKVTNKQAGKSLIFICRRESVLLLNYPASKWSWQFMFKEQNPRWQSIT